MSTHPAPFARRYLVTRELGKNELAEVFAARDLATQAEVVVKIARVPTSSVAHEAVLGMELSCRYLSSPLDFGITNGRSFFVQRFIPGVLLSTVSPTAGAPDGGEAWLRWAGHVARALEALHGVRLAHGDVKPANIIVSTSEATLIDLGLGGPIGSRLRGGTPFYLAPEANVDGTLSAEADVFAFGRSFEPLRTYLEGAISGASSREEANRYQAVATLLALAIDPRPAKRPSAKDLCAAMGLPIADERRSRFVTTFLGYRDVLTQLDHAVEPRDRDSRPHLVLVCGGNGAGKTRVLREWANRRRFQREIIDKHLSENFFHFLDRVAGCAIRGPLDFSKLWGTFPPDFAPLFVFDGIETWSEDERAFLLRWMRSAPARATFIGTVQDVAMLPVNGSVSTREVHVPPLATADLVPLFDRFPEHRAELRALGDRPGGVSPREIERLLFGAEARNEAIAHATRTSPRPPLPDLDAVDFDPFSFRSLLPTLSSESAGDLLFACHYHLRTGNIARALALALQALRRSRPEERDRIRLELIEIDARLGNRRGVRTLSRVPTKSPLRLRAELESAVLLLKLRRIEQAGVLLGAVEKEGLSPRFQLEHAVSTALCCSFLGKPMGQSEAAWLAREELPPDVFPPRTRFRALHAKAILAQRENRLADAERFYRSATRLAEAEHLSDLLVSSKTSLATLYHTRGDLGLALECYRSAERYSRDFGSAFATKAVRRNLLSLLLEIGALDEVGRMIGGQGEPDGSGTPDPAPLQDAQWWSASAELALHRGDLVAAESAARKARELCAAANAAYELAEAHLLEGEIKHASGRLTRADLSAWAYDTIEEASLRARYQRFHAEVHGASERFAESLRLAREAAAVFEELEEKNEIAKTAMLLCRIYRRTGATTLSEQAAVQARLIWEERMASLDEPYRSMFQQHPQRSDTWGAGPAEKASASRGPTTGNEVYPFATAVALADDERTIFRLTLDECVRLFDVERAFVLVVSPTGKTRVAYSKNIDQEEVQKAKNKFSRTLTERCIRSGEAFVSGNAVLDDPRNALRSVHVMQLRSVLIVPLKVDDRAVGAIYLDNRFREHAFDDGDRRRALEMATFVSACLRRVRKFELVTRDAAMRTVRETAAEFVDASKETGTPLGGASPFPEFVTNSPAVLAVLENARRVADTDVPVLVRGESGTGKERIARLVHDRSVRAKQPFIAINCGAMPEALLEGELFGYKKGAFTGATEDKRGLFVAASEGTLFLDELGEMPHSMQVKLLRVLQEKEVRPIGGEESVPIRTRVICATNRDLKAEVAAGRFREDLFYRVAVIDLGLPPLRERTEDIPLLVHHFLARFNRESGTNLEIDRKTMARLMHHPWPGNVRELENALRRGAVLSDGVRIQPADLMLEGASVAGQRVTMDEKSWLLGALVKANWNAQQTARNLGIPRASFYRKLRKHGLSRP